MAAESAWTGVLTAAKAASAMARAAQALSVRVFSPASLRARLAEQMASYADGSV